MEMYKTFAQCKLEHPDNNVWFDHEHKMFIPGRQGIGSSKNNRTMCSPENYLDPLDPFIKDGGSLSVGDFIVSKDGRVVKIRRVKQAKDASKVFGYDTGRLILKVASLEKENKPVKEEVKQEQEPKIKMTDNDIIDMIIELSTTVINRKTSNASMKSVLALTSLKAAMREEKSLSKAYELYCEFSGNNAMSFAEFDDSSQKEVWLFTSKKMEEK